MIENTTTDSKEKEFDKANPGNVSEMEINFHTPIIEEDEMVVDSPLIERPTIISWGRNDLGCLLRKKETEPLEGMYSYHSDVRNFVAVSSNGYHTAAVTATGELYTCGQNDEGQVSDHPTPVIERPQRVESLGNHLVTSVACGLNHTVCVTASGCAISFGCNESGQLGHTAMKYSKVAPRVVNFSLSPQRTAIIITKVTCGDLFSLFLTTSGEVFGCGSASFLGNVVNPERLIIHQAERIAPLVGTNIVDITAGSSHALALTASGELYGWGSNRHREIGLSDSSFEKSNNDEEANHQQIPVHIPLPENIGQIIGISAGYSHSIFWTNRGMLFGTGSNKYGQLALPFPRVDQFQHISLPFNCVMGSCGFNHTLVLCNAGLQENQDTVGSGKSDRLLGPPLIRVNSYNSTNTNMETGFSHVYAFGSNTFGQISSTSTATMFRSPVEISELREIVKVTKVLYVAAGGDQSFAIGLTDVKFSSEARSLLKKQFSSVASKAVVAMSAQSLRNLIQKCRVDEGEDQRMIGMTLSTVCEIFSSPSLIAGSFKADSIASSNRIAAIDVEGVEAIYVGLIQLGSHAVARLLGAMQQTVTELERALAAPGVALPESSVRVFLILWQSPLCANPLMASDVFLRLMKLTQQQVKNLIETIASYYPSHIFASRLIKPLHENLNYQFAANAATLATPAVSILCEALSWLFEVNKKKKMVTAEIFYNKALSELPDQILVKDYIQWRQYTQQQTQQPQQNSKSAENSFTQSGYSPLKPTPFFLGSYAFTLSATAKRRILLAEAMLQQQAAQNQSITQSLLSGAGVIFPWFIIPIEREHLLQQTLLHIASASSLDLKKPLKVIFLGEEGIDEGGVRKEFFQLLTGQLFNLEFGMFIPVAEGRSIWLNKENSWSKDEYQLVGSLLGLALYNGVLLDVHLPQVLYKKLLQQPVTLSDLETIDAALFTGLKQLLNFSPPEDVENVFCRNFAVEWDEFGATRSVDLIPNGSMVAVTGENRQLYVDKMVQWILNDCIQEQFQALYEGFTRVIHPNQLMLVTPEELELLMVGTPHLDFKELQSATEYIGENTWNADHPTIKWFWEVVHEDLSFEEKQKLLLFVTGSHKAPIGGLKNIGLKIQRMGPDSMSLPTAHTCFNVLLLPEYSSRDKLSERLKKAISECAGFGLK